MHDDLDWTIGEVAMLEAELAALKHTLNEAGWVDEELQRSIAVVARRLKQLTDAVDGAVVVDMPAGNAGDDVVTIGSRVTVLDVASGEQLELGIGSFIVRPQIRATGVVPYDSPLAVGLLGRREGDEYSAVIAGSARVFLVLALD
jgi:transcription elongation GreA/GreB family factor